MFARFVHIVICISILFLFVAEQYSTSRVLCAYTTSCLFTYLLADTWVVSALCLLWIMLQLSVSVSNFDFGAVYLGVELLNFTLIQSLAFEGTIELVSIEAAAFYIPMSNIRGFQLLYIFVNSCYFPFLFFNYSHPSMCRVLSCCGFDFQFPSDLWYWASFHACIGHLYIFFGELSIHAICPF